MSDSDVNKILGQIQSDLIRSDAVLADTLRKTAVLAANLHSTELRLWVSKELDGYELDCELPDYRVLKTLPIGQWSNGYYLVHDHSVPLFKISDEKLKELLTTLTVQYGVRKIEELAGRHKLNLAFSQDVVALVNNYVTESGYGYINIQYAVTPDDFKQILDSIKNRLLNFVLDLSDTWNIGQEFPQGDAINKLVPIIIYNNSREGNVSIIDQRGQRVDNQYNAANDVIVNNIHDVEGVISELERLIEEVFVLQRQNAIQRDIAIDAQISLLQAIREIEETNKNTFFQNLEKVKSLLEGVAAAGGLVTAIAKIVEVAKPFF